MNQSTVRRSRIPTSAQGRRLRHLARLAALAALAVPSLAAAQADVNPQMPNVLLLVDTSGSMEYMTSSNTFPICRYDVNGPIPSPPLVPQKSRWTDLVEVLTGSITNYDCETIDRGSAAFQNEYKIFGSDLHNSPYDFLYANPYHRPLSGTCAPGPGTISPTNPADFPANSFNYHTYNNVNASCNFQQSPDGILDAFASGLRFGLMTFDTDPSADQGELGTYSYVVGAAHAGKPTGCTTFQPMEVGARNASAPPWEGRLIPFGDPSPGSLDYQNKNAQIQQVLRATRPYGATPIAGMLSDARDFLWNDTSFDLVNTTADFGPYRDPYGACRQTVMVLLSDGQPNMDLRGHCTGNDCPFQLPEDIAHDLLVPSGHKPVKTYVIGFALNTLTVSGSPIDCSTLTSADLDTTTSSLCASHPDDQSLQACCNLARIAVAGDSSPNPHALFASDREQLRSDLSTVLGQQFPTTSRTQPVFASASSGGAGGTFAASYRFFTNFSPVLFQPWTGNVQRERWICDKDTHQPIRQDPDTNKGDIFADDLNSQQGRARTFYTVQGANTGGVFSDRTIRPNVSTDPDGAGAYSGTFSLGDSASTFVANTTPASMGLTDTSCVDTTTIPPTAMSASACRDRYMKWLVGLNNGTVFDRCLAGKCSLLGDVYHSTPKVVNFPTELTADNTYQTFQSTYAKRPLMLYTSTNDGFLHGFKVASNDPNDTETIQTRANNELWAFIPPQVLPHIPSEYPYTHQLLLDGVPVVADVVAHNTGSGTYPYVLERTVAQASSGSDPNTTWRTILVQGFGGLYPGYFALDVTNPDPTMTIGTETGGPKFLWQLTTDAAGNPLFGSGGGTPIITSLAFDDGNGVEQIPVAILPGGPGGAGNAGLSGTPGCPRASAGSDLAKLADYPPRPRVPCYTANLGARSLTIVRLDTGKIVRTFRRSKTELPAALQARVIEAPLDSPITGEPVAYPSTLGAVSDRVFVGDQDGTLWKADLSSSSPDSWKMALFWDAFPNLSIHSQPASGWNDGQPISTAPVLSVDTVGNVTLAVSTGDQTALGASANMLNYVWSLREIPNSDRSALVPDLLWFEQFVGGERVTGPMSLFASYLYFSTVQPPPANQLCASSGGTKIWGMHYMIPRDGVGTTASPPDRTVGGQAAPFILTNFQSTAQFVPDTTLLGTAAANQAVIFGVTVAQVPTCFDTDTLSDQYGTRTRFSNVTPGKFQLVAQTGSATLGTDGKGNVSTAGTTSFDLTTPMMTARINAWASIVE